jgi:hypothetical protein
MAKQPLMLRFARWHIWLGWLVGLPILMWTVTGLVMIARPIEEVRGDDLRARPAPLMIGDYAMPDFGEPVSELQLVQQAIGPVWIVTTADGARRRYFASDATLLPPVIESEARQIAGHVYAGKAKLETVGYIPYDEVPIELRRPVNAWRLGYSDGTNLYLEAATGELLAVRTPGWRIYDFAWGLHIMDPQTREDTHHPLILVFTVLSVIGATLGCVLLFRRRKARVGIGAKR